MDIKEFETKIFHGLSQFFEAESFAMLIDKKQFRKTTSIGFANVIFILLDYENDTWADVHIGIRNNQIEQIAQQFLNINLDDFQTDVNTLVISIGKYHNNKYFRYKLTDDEELHQICSSVKDFMLSEGFSFLHENQDLQHIDHLINATYHQTNKYVYNQIHRCFKGLICAKLTANSRYTLIKESYKNYINQNGSLPEQESFDRLINYLYYYNPN